jgi:hypothetical protein
MLGDRFQRGQRVCAGREVQEDQKLEHLAMCPGLRVARSLWVREIKVANILISFIRHACNKFNDVGFVVR